MKSKYFLFCLLFIVSCNTDDGFRLRFNLKKGKSYTYTEYTETEAAAVAVAASQPNRIKRTYVIEVLDDSNGIKSLKNTFGRFVVNMALQQGSLYIDTDLPFSDTSTSPDALEVMKGMFHALKNRSFYTKVNAEGDIIEVRGVKEMGEAMIQGMRLDKGIRDLVQHNFTQIFNDETLKQSLSQMFNVYPDTRVGIGDSWQKSISIPAIRNETKSTYTLKEFNNGDLVIDVRSEMKIGDSKGIQTGRFVLDTATGLVLSGNYEQKFDGMVSRITISGKELTAIN